MSSLLAYLCILKKIPWLPAGAVLTHANLIADSAGTVELLDEWLPGDKHIR